MSCSRIVLVLDASGSMSSQADDIVGSLNETIKEQRRSMPYDTTTMFSVILFSSEVASPINHKLCDIPFFRSCDYKPNGSTALYDAIGLTIERYKDERNVIFLIMTDGQENASKHYKYSHITDMIKKIKDTKNWNFIYLSEDIETSKQGSSIGLDSFSKNCNNIMTGKKNLGFTLANTYCQQAISKMRQGESDVKINIEQPQYRKSSSPGVASSVPSFEKYLHPFRI